MRNTTHNTNGLKEKELTGRGSLGDFDRTCVVMVVTVEIILCVVFTLTGEKIQYVPQRFGQTRLA